MSHIINRYNIVKEFMVYMYKDERGRERERERICCGTEQASIVVICRFGCLVTSELNCYQKEIQSFSNN